MAKLMGVLGEEIRRLARKEIRFQTARTKQAASRHRREIAALKRDVRDLQRLMKKASLASGTARAAGPAENLDIQDGTRFSARSVAAQRRRLGLSAADFGKLVGVSGLTIYNWEQKKSRPRVSQLQKYLSVRGLPKKEALSRLGRAD